MPPKPAIFSPKPISLEEDDSVSSLDEALEILEIGETKEPEIISEPVEEKPVLSFTSAPPTPEPIELEPIDIEPSTPAPFTTSVPSSTLEIETSTPQEVVEEKTEAFVPFVAGPVQDKPKPLSTGSTGTWLDFLKKEKVEEEDKPTFVPFLLSDYKKESEESKAKIEEPKEIILEVVSKKDKNKKKKGKDKKKEKVSEEGRVCPSCHKMVPGGWRFCTYCGQALD